MKRKTLTLGIAAIAIAIAAFSTAPTLASGASGHMGHMGHGYGRAMMGSQGYGHGAFMMGSGNTPCDQTALEGDIGLDDVKSFVEGYLQMRGNDRLKIGKIEAAGDDTIVAEIVTVDGSLVDKIEFDTKTGAHRPID